MLTIDSLVDTSHIAHQRRQAGLPTWVHTLRLREAIQDRSGQRIAATLRDSSWFRQSDDQDLEDAIVEFGDIADDEHFDEVLSALYHLADADRVRIV